MFSITPEVHQRLAMLLYKRLSFTCYNDLVQAPILEVIDEIIFAAQIGSSTLDELQSHIEMQMMLVYQISAKHELEDKRDDLTILATRLQKSMDASALSRLHTRVHALLKTVLCEDFPRTMMQMEHYESSMRHVKRLYIWLQELKRQNVNILHTVQWKASSQKMPFFACVSPTAQSPVTGPSPADSLCSSSCSSISSDGEEQEKRSNKKRKHNEVSVSPSAKKPALTITINQIEEYDEEDLDSEDFMYNEQDEEEAFEILQSLKKMIHDPFISNKCQKVA